MLRFHKFENFFFVFISVQESLGLGTRNRFFSSCCKSPSDNFCAVLQISYKLLLPPSLRNNIKLTNTEKID